MKFASIGKHLDVALDSIGRVALLCAGIIICIEVFSRYVLGISHDFSMNIVIFLILSGVFLLGGVNLKRDAHLKVDFFLIKLKGKTREAVELVLKILTLIVVVLLFWSGVMYVKWAILTGVQVQTAQGSYPHWIDVTIFPVGMFFFSLYALTAVIASMRQIQGKQD